MTAAATPKKRSVVFIAVVVFAVLFFGCACVGVLSVIAVPAFTNYTLRAKTTEARAELRALARSEMTHCAEFNNWLVPAGPVPISPRPEKQAGDFASDPVFAQLDYTRADYGYYSYSIRRDAATTGGIELVAQGDLDGDGVLSSFSIRCGASCLCDEVQVVDELE
jgi:Tfp pilus assembly protein PilE